MQKPNLAKDDSNNAYSEEGLTFIWKNIERIGNCMLATQTSSEIRARPMRGLARQEENAIWFFTSRSSPKDAEITAHPHVCLSYSDTASNTYISLSGTMEHEDRLDKVKELWNPGAEAYFSNGPTDPDVALLKFIPAGGEYWDAPSNPVVIAVQFIKAKVMGEPVHLGENAKVQMGG